MWHKKCKLKDAHRNIIVHLQPGEDFTVEDMVEEGALDEVRARSSAITMVKLYIFRRILGTPLTLPVNIVDSLTI